MSKTILFIGLGGAGQRHLRLLNDLYGDDIRFTAFRSRSSTPLLTSDFSVDTADTVENRYGVRLFDTIEDAFAAKPHYVVISTPTACHIEYALAAAKSGAHILLEKPFSDSLLGFSDFKELVLQHKSHFMLSFQRRFHPFSKKIKSILDQQLLGKMLQVTIQVSSYVPAWHPYEEFRDLYACRKDLGGGVLLTECHELDLCYWFFGLPETVYCSGTSVSGLDVEDTVQLVLNYTEFSITLNLTFMHRQPKRRLSFSGEKGDITCDFVNNTLDVHYFNNSDASFVEKTTVSNDDPFIEQARYFMSSFSHQESLSYLNTAHATMTLIELAKDSLSSQSVQKLRHQEAS